eukprot:1738741-Rhodomonas_salina.1
MREPCGACDRHCRPTQCRALRCRRVSVPCIANLVARVRHLCTRQDRAARQRGREAGRRRG